MKIKELRDELNALPSRFDDVEICVPTGGIVGKEITTDNVSMYIGSINGRYKIEDDVKAEDMWMSIFSSSDIRGIESFILKEE